MEEKIELINELSTQNFTKIKHTNDNHNFEIVDSQNEFNVLTDIHFQDGPTKEVGLNGIFNEDLLIIVLERLKAFQNTEFKCKENEMAIIKIEEALLWLKKRTLNREKRGVQGTSNI